ncbi:MAG: hypothetical protein RIE08_16330 [Acidimicrobiales bacterium]
MTTPDQPGTLRHHLEHLAADADDVVAMLTRRHAEGGDIHPEPLAKAERLQTSLREVIDALTHHEHLAMGADDVWAMLTRKHSETEIFPDDSTDAG